MSEPLKISTKDYVRRGKISVDGHIWDAVLPGAGTELRFSQATRASKLYASRVANLEKILDTGQATDEQLDQYEEYCKKYDENEKIVYDIIKVTFKDGTPDNSEVATWIEETPTAFIIMAFNEVKSGSDNDTEGTPAGS